MNAKAKFICNSAARPQPLPHPWDHSIRYFNSPDCHLVPGNGLAAFRCDFDLPEGTALVKLTATALGIFDVYINGARVGNEELKPGWTDYHCRVFEFEYDVTSLCKEENLLTAAVSNGWWSGRISMGEYGWREPAFAAAIECFDEKGALLAEFVSGEDWQTTVGGRVLYADIWDGEYYDATMPDVHEFPGGYVWRPADVMQGELPAILPHVGEPVRVRPAFNQAPKSAVIYRDILPNGTDFGEISPISTRVGAGCEKTLLRAGEKLVLDLGQEMVGCPQITLKAPRRAHVEITVAEMLNDSGDKARGNDGPKGSLYMANYRTAKARALYVAAGNGVEQYRPTYAFFGFRYFSITADADIEILDVKGLFISTDMQETGSIETDNAEINRFIRNVFWGQRCNYLSIPTDCPQRDERLGWSGDTQMFSGAATYNANARGFLKKWLGDARDGQRVCDGYWDVIPVIEKLSRSGSTKDAAVAWGDAGIIVPYTLYLKYNDVETLAEHYDSMERYMAYLIPTNGPHKRYGDWLAYEPTDEDYVCLAYYAYDACLMAKMAAALGKEDRAAHYTDLFQRIKCEFNEKYVKDGALIVCTQTAYLVALAFDLIEGEVREGAIKSLKQNIEANDYTLSTGFIGTSILAQTLSKVGLDELAYSLLLQTRDPSWLYSVRQGATTVWERWNSYTRERGFGAVNMNSFNHYAYGAVLEWMYAFAAGIRVDEQKPGFQHFILSPRPDTRTGDRLPAGQKPIGSVRARYQSVAGEIESGWYFREGKLVYTCKIPEGTSARVEFPLLNGSDRVVINDLCFDVAALGGKICGEKAIFELSAGEYTIQ
ncbi:MAG: family 78 glycoside hydrolase catalytic domain [Clostridia bacterium]|nr:family 78 glycoside hydrolase catalytic domain [Clostridia bacterium]